MKENEKNKLFICGIMINGDKNGLRWISITTNTKTTTIGCS